MKIKLLGELGLIERIKNKVKPYQKGVVRGIGDDAAVLEYDKNNYLLFTTDSLVEGVHFSVKYSKPWQIGMKAIEQNVSDIAAMGGLPKYAAVSLALPNNIDVKFIDGLYRGINKKCKKYGISVVGGNITRSKKISVSVAMTGIAEKKYLALRSGAKKGDLIFCSGDVGKSAAGLGLLKHNKKGKSAKKHLEPSSRLELAGKLVKIGVNSMIDVSDGVASEARHICNESNVGAVIYADKIPISKNTIIDAKKLNKNALDFALYGGEDFELVFTAGKNKISRLKKLDVSAIGKIVGREQGVKLAMGNKKTELKMGFEHFQNKK
ncbi:thiamine-phosphate kinase [Candidatus Woesearchaeota archaeon]|nr:thiamine-phosphate kinase [Candidatus Woesearchaeota archaeon]